MYPFRKFQSVFKVSCICFLLIYCTFIVSGQSFDVSFKYLLNGQRFVTHEFEIPLEYPCEFLAVSVRLQNKDIAHQIKNVQLRSSKEDFQLLAFQDAEDNDDLFISNILYLKPEEAGLMTLVIEGLGYSRENILEGYIRVFVPQAIPINPFEKTTPYSNCNCPQPPHITRSQWGTQFGLNQDIHIPPAAYTQVTHLIVHHSAGTNESNNWPAVVAAIFDFHSNTNGWQDIGYNWLIDPTGTLYEGRGGGDNVRGAHMCGFNDNTMGVCVLGNFEVKEPSEDAVYALERLLAWKSCQESIDPMGRANILSHNGNMFTISGHLEGCRPNHTVCPGNFFFTKLDKIRLNTKEVIATQCEEITSVEEKVFNEMIDLYPNPAQDYVCLSEATGSTVLITDFLGQCHTMTLHQKCLDISNLKPGMYTVRIEYDNSWIPKKLIKI